MLSGNLFDLSCQIVRTFGDHNRGLRHLGIVFDSNRIMGGVGDDHIRLGKVLHHSPLGDFPHLLPDTSFDLRVTFLLFIFFFNLLFGHPHVLTELVLLIDEVRRSNDHVDQGDPDT